MSTLGEGQNNAAQTIADEFVNSDNYSQAVAAPVSVRPVANVRNRHHGSSHVESEAERVLHEQLEQQIQEEQESNTDYKLTF